ncbi:hypothetical protein [Mycobacteroides abscessus]|uniref:hypothetical protein n=1 Tax=Mycobacteroides abscessus TaxID=36809 RepID=UPI002105BF28|nr:hypothetical protein [Mycobacteroides abscessus]
MLESEDPLLDHDEIAGRTERYRRGLGGTAPDCALIARSGHTSIWHTEKTASGEHPRDLPPLRASVVYRGFHYSNLLSVLQSGLDVPAQAAFWASDYPDKAWQYPVRRTRPMLLVLDSAATEISYAQRPAGAGESWEPDKTRYPHSYQHRGGIVHTRFGPGCLPASFEDEHMYGRWVPGDARQALLAVVMGGPKSDVLQLLREVQLLDPQAVQIIG